jgi:hypothetical protein
MGTVKTPAEGELRKNREGGILLISCIRRMHVSLAERERLV